MSIETWETIRLGRVAEFLGTMAVRIEKRWYGSDITLIGPYGMGIDTASEPAWWAILVGSEDMRKSGCLAVSDLPGERILVTLDPGSFIDRASLQPFWDWLSQAMDRYGFVESETKPAEKGVGKPKPSGTQGGTLARVKTARGLIEQGEPKTKACKRAHIDPRTYDRYVAEIIDWEEITPDL